LAYTNACVVYLEFDRILVAYRLVVLLDKQLGVAQRYLNIAFESELGRIAQQVDEDLL